jgi:hypothetical protein
VFLGFVVAPGLLAQERNAMEPRPPLILAASRTERLEAAVRLYLHDFIGAMQRGDTMALGVLVPEDAVPDAERLLAGRAGCASLGRATAALGERRSGESSHPALPLAALHLRSTTILITSVADTVARVATRVAERRGNRIRFVPVELVFIERDGTLRLASAPGVLAGVCGLTQGMP